MEATPINGAAVRMGTTCISHDPVLKVSSACSERDKMTWEQCGR